MMKKKKLCFAILCGMLPLLFASCKSDEDPFADIATAKKSTQEKEEKKKTGSLLDQLDFSGSERAKRKARLRDVSRPLNDTSSEGRIFPWRDGGTSRSEALQESLRGGDSGPVYYDW